MFLNGYQVHMNEPVPTTDYSYGVAATSRLVASVELKQLPYHPTAVSHMTLQLIGVWYLQYVPI